jgi:hypothetical protein
VAKVNILRLSSFVLYAQLGSSPEQASSQKLGGGESNHNFDIQIVRFAKYITHRLL